MAFQKPSHTFTKIHLKALRTNNFYIVFILSFTVFINTFSYAQEVPKPKDPIKPKPINDTLVVGVDSLFSQPINIKEKDTLVSDSIPKKKEFLTDVVKYKAKEYVSINQRLQKIYLYDEAEVYYQDMEIKSGIIVIDYSKNLVYAGRLKDSAGVYSQAPKFKQGANLVEPDSIIFNTETKKALIYNSRTEQSGGYIDAALTKKENDSVYFIKDGKFTTSENRDDPEFYFYMRKAKIVPNKKVVVGLTNMYIYNVPTPIGLPFAYFPMTDKQTSGIIFPSFGQENERGYFLQNGGYYFAISDYIDLAVLGDYYTNGSYGLRVESSYAWRYHFRGNIGFRYENLITSERGFPDYAKSSVYNIRWSHNQDQKSNPSSRFSASVNLGSSRYYQESLNQLNASNFLNNTLSSSVSYSKTFQGEPQVNMSVTATHSQNTNTQQINMTLPTFQASVSRIFPFEPKTGTKKGIIQNVNFQYNVRAENRIQTTDSLFFKKEMFDDALTGVQHSIPFTTNFKLFKYFSLSANANFDENWTLNTIKRYYDTTNDEVVTEDIRGFDSFRTYNFSTSIGTTIYGMFDFKKEGKDPKIQAIRHVMRPSISYNINPAFDEYYDTFDVITANGTTRQEYSRFEESIFGAPNKTFSSSLGISVANNFEAKIRDKDSTATEPKKIILLNNLNFATSYNFAADSLRWSPVRVSGGTQILNDKMSINFGAVLDPYALDNNNNKIDQFNINNGGSLFRLTNANINMSYTLSSKSFSGETDTDRNAELESLRSGGRSDDLFGKPQDFADKRLTDEDRSEKDEEPSEFYNYKIPWSLRLAYAVNYSNNARENEISSHSLMFSGDIELSPKWTVGASSGYDFKNQGFTYTQLRFERDLLSWRMNFSWIPFSTRSSWNFFIGIKSSLLKDIKYDQRKRPDQQL
ncbi:organic solvent tolerance protein OstA [Aquaticitalea lipolytica]|uniref:Organic solvent tolerance protein OstA n=1 Tax=Aquaticitalea lipolytica TaxID=1247562 RepID=A0A8J2TRZ1_9FLAO|nr:putative LPS assembly protein LptD [Aquaticitalea lipolytica]GFZ84739.1 organic solvent tolerance protein OstA [Aquaticitalea lipolytica]